MKSQLKRGEVNLSAQVRDLIEEDITTGLLRPGQKLDETQLSDKYGVSRTPIREALKHLASKGLVDLKTNRGAYVRQISLTTLIEMFETMSALESACACLTARRHNAQDHEALVAANKACLDATEQNSPDAYYAANIRFHELIYNGARNNYLRDQTIRLRNTLEPYRRATTFHPGLMRKSNEEHSRILHAVLNFDEQAASAEMHLHLDTLRNDAIWTFESILNRISSPSS